MYGGTYRGTVVPMVMLLVSTCLSRSIGFEALDPVCLLRCWLRGQDKLSLPLGFLVAQQVAG